MSIPQLVREESSHCLHLYKGNEQSFARKVAEYLSEGLRRGEGVLVIATPEHWNAFVPELRRLDTAIDHVLSVQQLVLADPKHLLAEYMAEGQPVWERFERLIAAAFGRVRPAAGQIGLRAYGDMVGLLWQQGMYSAAICVEEFWNRFLQSCGSHLFCGYPVDILEGDLLAPEIQALFRTHTHVVSGDEYGDAERAVRRATQEVLGRDLIEFQGFPPLAAGVHGTRLPPTEAKILWLRQQHPDAAREILTRAREYYPAEKRFRALIENSAEVIFLADPDGIIVYASPSTNRVLGRTPGEVVDRNVLDLVHPDDRERVCQALQTVLAQSRPPLQFETRVRRDDETWSWIECTFSNLLDEPEVQAIVANFHDITDRKRAQDALRVSEARLAARESYLRTVLDCLPECVKVLGPHGELVEMNRVGLEMIEADSADQVLGACIYPLIDVPDREAFQALNEGVFQGGNGGALEFAVTGLKGKRQIFDTCVAPLRDETNTVVGALSTTRNITQRKQAEMDRLHLAAIVSSSEDAIISKDLNGRITSWNQAAERMFGYSAEEVLGRPISILAVPDRPSEMPGILNRIRRGERVEHYETVRQTREGRLLHVSLTISPIRDAAGTIIGASKIVRDITEKKRIEALVQKTNEELRRANTDLEQFAYAAAHDLQEPLRMVSLYSQKLQRQCADTLEESAQEYLSYLTQGARHMELLVSDILAYTQAANFPLDDGVVTDANLALTKALSHLTGAIDEQGAVITCESLPRLRVQEAPLVQLFQNLVGNAIKYRGGEAPRIHISSVQQGTHRKICVSDNGLGIAPQYAKQIFGLFKRLHHYQQYPGTGIGLALCQRIVERAGGQIWVESSGEGLGSTFCFTLPGGDH